MYNILQNREILGRERRKAMLPERFCERARELLGEEYPDFLAALEGEAIRGVRANLIKTNAKRVSELFGEEINPLDYCDNGFTVESSIRLGHTAEHHAGMIYAQDPGAMATVAAIELRGDELVLDACAAPGGKSSQVAEQLTTGSLLSNEYVPKRAKIIVGNFERLGVKNALVTSLDTAQLGKMYDAVFDLVIVDAPCSGEGMFRKSEEALAEWSEENVRLCAERQIDILNNLAPTVKGGGRLLYSTCTYAPEENEFAVDAFLKSHPDFHIVRVKDEVERVTRDGIRFEGISAENIEYCRRFYPHVSRGEGQFLALLERENNNKMSAFIYNDCTKPLSKSERSAVEAFFRDSLTEAPEGRLAKYGENIVLISHGLPVPPHSVFMSGVLVGEIAGSVFKPSHQFFSVFGELFKSRLYLTQGDREVDDYLLGREIASEAKNGWCAVIYEGSCLGGGKVSGGRLKNHYPKGLRNKG